MPYELDSINSMVLDVLKEIGNIGAGNAATALAKLLNQKVDMNIPKVKILEFKDVPEVIGGAETQVCGVFFKLEGDLNGSIMFLLDMESAFSILNLLMPSEKKEINEMSISAIQEIGNILSGSYVSSLSVLTNLNISISVPSMAIDMAGAILSVPAIQFGLTGDKMLIIENQFSEIEPGKDVKGVFLLVPDSESYPILLNSLGVSI